MTRFFIRQMLIERGISTPGLRDFDAMTAGQFELWHRVCWHEDYRP